MPGAVETRPLFNIKKEDACHIPFFRLPRLEQCFKGAKVFDGSAIKFGRSRQDAGEMLLKRFGQNAEGVCSITWKGTNRGHAFNWKIKDGIVSFFDGQTGSDDSSVSRYWSMIDPNGALQLIRLDNLDVNMEAVKNYI